ncbi:RNA pseudouridylate synthase domain-containing protein 1 isoform X3 [Nycticebus coucang]|uniref:RNA pseudouridylate synthase domain-containing protein 1 isoform X3 n=1 Tax=Nycticebus coucang TaxID=9470 RepID=UPI00234CFC99|nr:RNA pseudouridylate synthase domain-containing protein 1 isoform X3 [Nycticebus coucang]XP_053412520.1 RNA pseudouridylate synthase domain-containing protein 1 isoform X3 [Nycticebus coucang]
MSRTAVVLLWVSERTLGLEPRPRSGAAPRYTSTLGGRPIMEPGSMENLSIVYRSSDFLVVNKHWDVRIDSKMWRETLTLQKQLRHRFPELADPDTCYGFRFCHQLDFSTSGALCVALNKAAAGSAYRCFKERRVTKAYLALVRGHVQDSQVTISYAIGRNSTEGRAHTMCIEGTQGCENPKPSLTELVVLEHGLYAGDPVSKVLLKPLTGCLEGVTACSLLHLLSQTWSSLHATTVVWPGAAAPSLVDTSPFHRRYSCLGLDLLPVAPLPFCPGHLSQDDKPAPPHRRVPQSGCPGRPRLHSPPVPVPYCPLLLSPGRSGCQGQQLSAAGLLVPAG